MFNFNPPGGYVALTWIKLVGTSALGQKQTFAVQKGMSALPPIADMCIASCGMSALCQ